MPEDEERAREILRRRGIVPVVEENVLLDVVYDEPNEVTKAAIEEARNRKDYPESELYGSAKEMFEAISKENEENLSVGAV